MFSNESEDSITSIFFIMLPFIAIITLAAVSFLNGNINSEEQISDSTEDFLLDSSDTGCLYSDLSGDTGMDSK
jgi:hypothetical protein